MGASVKASPQVKVTCKQIIPKLNIESIDKNTLNNLKKSIDKYYLNLEIIDTYKGEVDEEGFAVDTDDYNAWRRNHPNKISKQSVNNIIKSIKNNSLVNWTLGKYVGGIGYNSSAIHNSNGFEIKLLSIYLIPTLKVSMIANLINLYYFDDELDVDVLSSEFESK